LEEKKFDNELWEGEEDVSLHSRLSEEAIGKDGLFESFSLFLSLLLLSSTSLGLLFHLPFK
jgi:hypothetical protein